MGQIQSRSLIFDELCLALKLIQAQYTADTIDKATYEGMTHIDRLTYQVKMRLLLTNLIFVRDGASQSEQYCAHSLYSEAEELIKMFDVEHIHFDIHY